MVLAQFKKDLANLQALAQKVEPEAVSTQTQEIEEPSVEVEKTSEKIEEPSPEIKNHCRRSKNHRKRSKNHFKKTHLVMEQYARWILRHRRIVPDSGHAFDDCFGISCIWCKIIIDPGALAPNGHPYITSTKLIEKFGSKYMVVIGITPNKVIFISRKCWKKVKRITEEVDNAPGVVRSTMMSLAARQAKGIMANSEGFDAKNYCRPVL